MLATIVETQDLLETVAASVIAGVGVTIVFSLAIYGATRFADLSRDERPVAAGTAAADRRSRPWRLHRRGGGRDRRDDEQVDRCAVRLESRPCASMRTLRNVAIVLLLALIVAFGPGGGNGADTVLTALTMGFLVAIAAIAYQFSRQNELTLATLSDGRRALLFGALGLIALLIAGTDEFFDRAAGRWPGSCCSAPPWRRSGASGSRRAPTSAAELGTSRAPRARPAL